MVANPCCCCTVQTGTKVVAIVNIVFSVIGIIFSVLGMLAVLAVGVAAYSSEDRPKDSDAALAATGIVVLIVAIITLLVLVGYLVVCIFLLMGANQRHYGKCKLWFIVTLVFLVLYIIRTLYETVEYGRVVGAGAAVGSFIGLLIGAAITGWQLWTVYAFMEELKSDGTPSGQAGYVHAKQNEEA